MTSKVHTVRSWQFWARRFMEVGMACIIAYMSINLIEYREAVERANVPPDEWFLLHEIFVPDHEMGSNPEMIYDRHIFVTHRGFWVAEVQRINPDGREGVFENACTGSGVDEYEVTDVLSPGNAVTWEWFFGRPCTIPPGQYRVLLTRDMTIPGWPIKRTRHTSNTFTVLPQK